jgi:hypothetical protein
MDQGPRWQQVIGLDFDNTLICYDRVFVDTAAAWGLLRVGEATDKQAVREAVRGRGDGDLDWQRLQGHVYGKGIGGARLFPGVEQFLRQARCRGVALRIVSHKTEYGHFDPDRVNLRSAALAWMEEIGLFSAQEFPLRREHVHFVPTRQAKLELIGALGCTMFIDDLPEVLDDPGFPPGVTRILFAPSAAPGVAPYRVCPDWSSIEQAVFG